MKQRYNELTPRLCYRAVTECFRKKWARNDVLTVIEEYAGIPRKAMKEELKTGGVWLKTEAITAIADEMGNRLIRLKEGKQNALDLDPVIFRKQTDGMNGKIRDIAYECIFHQLFNHLAYLALQPLFDARILPYQYASIPNKGQSGLKKYVTKIMRKKSRGIKFARKTDICKAYPSTQYSVIISIIEKEIPSATLLIALLKELAKMSPKGCLIIGGYLDAWLFNYLMSYVIKFALSQHKQRRNKNVPLIKAQVSFMDDFGLFASREANLGIIINKIKSKLSNYDLSLKIGKETAFLSFEQERARRRATAPSKRACPYIDIAGYCIHHGYTTIRKAIFLRARRCFLRAASEIARFGYLTARRAYSLIAYYGYFKQSNARKIRKTLSAEFLHTLAKATISHHQKQLNGGIPK